MPKLTPKQEKILRLSKAQGSDKDLLFLDMLQETNEHLEAMHKLLSEISGKEYPQFPEIPEPKEADLSKVEELLARLVEKENEPIEITLDII